jgi:hypothetical protein
MRCRPVCLALAMLASTAAARAASQQGPEPSLALTLLAGAVDGANLWTIDRQPFCPVFSGGTCASPPDTLRLARTMSSSIVIGASMAYFAGPRFGIHAEVAYVGLPLRDACAVLNASPTQPSSELCADIQGASQATGAVAFSASVLLRMTSRRSLSPFVRGGFGLIVYNHSTIEMFGADRTGAVYQVLRDDTPRRIAQSFMIGAGTTLALGPGYQFRLEARDVIARFERVTGPADALVQPPTGTRFSHHVGLTMGLDIVLERKRGRRY